MKTWQKIKLINTMYSNIINIFRNIAFYISEAFRNILDLPKILKELLVKLKLFIHDQRFKFNHITEINMELGRYHLRAGHITDAILRFKIAQFFFAKNNPEICYWLGWCYFIKGKYDIATKYLEEGKDADELNLGDFIKNANSLKEVPRAIWEDMREITLIEGNKKYYSKDLYHNNIDLPMEFTEFFLNTIQELVSKPKIIDYGSGTGLAGSYLDYKLDKKYEITGVENNELCLDYIKKMRGERGYVYDNIHRAYLDNPERAFDNTKYDIILSFDSIGFAKDLSKIFKAFHKNLLRHGIVALLLPSSPETMWDQNRKSYSYSVEELSKQVILAKFDITDIKEWSLGKNRRYVSIIARK